MQVKATDIFRVGSGVSAGGSRAAAALGGAATTRAEQDIVSISTLARQMQARGAGVGEAGFVAKGGAASTPKPAAGLAEALTGEVARIFSYLKDEAKATLEQGVASGRVSIREVEEGLKYLANEEVANRVGRSRERSQEELEAGDELISLTKLADDFGREYGFMSLEYDDLNIRRRNGEITHEEYTELSAEIDEKATQLTNSDLYKDVWDRYGAAMDKALRLSVAGWQKALGGPFNEATWQPSSEKLAEIGFDVYRNRQSFVAYAAAQETPTMFRADSP